MLQRPFKCFDGRGLAKGKSGPPDIFATNELVFDSIHFKGNRVPFLSFVFMIN